MIKDADSRLFVAKKNGRNQVVWNKVVAEFATTQAYKKIELRQNLPQFKKKALEKLSETEGWLIALEMPLNSIMAALVSWRKYRD